MISKMTLGDTKSTLWWPTLGHDTPQAMTNLQFVALMWLLLKCYGLEGMRDVKKNYQETTCQIGEIKK